MLATVTDDTGYYSFDNLLWTKITTSAMPVATLAMPSYSIVFWNGADNESDYRAILYIPTFAGNGQQQTDNNWNGFTPIAAVPIQGLVDDHDVAA